MGTAYSAADIFADPHMAARGDLVAVDDPVIGPVRQQAPFPRLANSPAPVPRGAPRLGEHNREVWCDLVGLSDDELADLAVPRRGLSPSRAVVERMTESSPQELLKAEQEKTIARIVALTAEMDDIVAATMDANVDDEHDPEGSTIAFERARVATLLSQGRAYLGELELARHRIERWLVRNV